MPRKLSLPRTWFVTARLLEIIAVVMVAGAVYETWGGWNVNERFDPSGPEDDVRLMPRLVNVAVFTAFRGPISLLLAGIAVAAVVAILLRAQPVAHARILRWESLGLGIAVGVLALLHVVILAVVALFGGEALGGPGFIGPDLVSQLAINAPWPVASLLVAATAGLWWLRLPGEFDEPLEEAPVRGEDAAAEDDGAQHAISDDSPFEGAVEQIEPVERFHLGEQLGSDGATSSGYEDYFRRS